METSEEPVEDPVEVRVRRLHRRDLNRTWEFLKLVFRDVNRETVEYQRPRSKKRFLDIYEEDEAEQLLFESENEVVGYAECTFEIGSGSDNWLNPRYFEKRSMRPMFVDELAVHPRMQGRGVGGFMIDQLQHLARLRGCTHLVLEVAENNRDALTFYKHRGFQKMDAAIFMAQKIDSAPDLLPPRKLKGRGAADGDGLSDDAGLLEDGDSVSLDVALTGKPIKSSLPKKKKPKKRAAKKRSSERPRKAPASSN
jgi:ribosomal protein S18 acetylase RimI-like enzyme